MATLRMVSFRLEQGQALGVIGPSGSGKSTLLRTINVLEEPTEGKVFFDGMELTDIRPEPGPGEVLVKVAGCGVCHTDLGFYYDGLKHERLFAGMMRGFMMAGGRPGPRPTSASGASSQPPSCTLSNCARSRPPPGAMSITPLASSPGADSAIRSMAGASDWSRRASRAGGSSWCVPIRRSCAASAAGRIVSLHP